MAPIESVLLISHFQKLDKGFGAVLLNHLLWVSFFYHLSSLPFLVLIPRNDTTVVAIHLYKCHFPLPKALLLLSPVGIVSTHSIVNDHIIIQKIKQLGRLLSNHIIEELCWQSLGAHLMINKIDGDQKIGVNSFHISYFDYL